LGCPLIGHANGELAHQSPVADQREHSNGFDALVGFESERFVTARIVRDRLQAQDGLSSMRQAELSVKGLRIYRGPAVLRSG